MSAGKRLRDEAARRHEKGKGSPQRVPENKFPFFQKGCPKGGVVT